MQREHLTRILTDSMHRAIEGTTRSHLVDTVKQLNGSISHMINDLYAKQESAYREINERYASFELENKQLLDRTRQIVEAHGDLAVDDALKHDVLDSEWCRELTRDMREVKEGFKKVETDHRYLRENQVTQRSLSGKWVL